MVAFAGGCLNVKEDGAPKPFPEFSAVRAITKGPHDHFLGAHERGGMVTARVDNLRVEHTKLDTTVFFR